MAEGLDMPNGVAVRNQSLYVAENSRLIRFEHAVKDPGSISDYDVVYDGFPKDEVHGWKFIRFGPDGRLYIPVGAPCNICRRKNEVYASILSFDIDLKEYEVYAHGVRNTVGFDFNPETGNLWFTDNGRDWLGDDLPPDELNTAPSKGLDFGYPYCHGKDVVDPEYGRGSGCDGFTPPVLELGPHVAALGMRFYKAAMFPNDYFGDVFIAEHGSWNRKDKIGYRVTHVSFNADGSPSAYEPFLTGFLDEKGEVKGRPVDIEVLDDGSMLVSDDRGGVIYRISWERR